MRRRRGDLTNVARVFLRIGLLGFGGPAAHIAMMREELVRRRGWLDDRQFLDLVAATNLIPGPNSTELAIHIGQRRAGWYGFLVAGACFIGPAVAIVAVLAWLYERHGTSSHLDDLRYGILPVIIGIIAQAVVGLGRTALGGVVPALLAAAATAAYLLDVHELLVLLTAGIVSMVWAQRGHFRSASLLLLVPAWVGPPAMVAVSRWRLFWVFVEMGSVLYGSGYVLIAFLQRNLVDDRGWLSTQQLLDAVAVGQVTPGPLFSTATFVGWQIDGPVGAALATVGIFLPAFVLVALLARIVPWMQSHPTARTFLNGVTAASLGLMAGVVVELAEEALVDGWTVVLALGVLALLVRTNVNTAWLILGGIAAGAIQAMR